MRPCLRLRRSWFRVRTTAQQRVREDKDEHPVREVQSQICCLEPERIQTGKVVVEGEARHRQLTMQASPLG